MGTSKTVKGIFFPSSRLDAPSNEIYLSGLSLMFSFAPMKKLKDFSFYCFRCAHYNIGLISLLATTKIPGSVQMALFI